MTEENRFYVYVYLDPRKQGQYTYENTTISFLYEPFYIGKGTKNRCYKHLWEAENTNKNFFRLNKIRKILKEGYEPIIMKIFDKLSNDTALQVEIDMISLIGRADKNLGSLTNMTDGGDGNNGFIRTVEYRKKLSEALTGIKKPPRKEEHTKKQTESVKKFYETEEGIKLKKKIGKRTTEKLKGRKRESGVVKWNEESKENYKKLLFDRYNSEEGERIKRKQSESSKKHWVSEEGTKRKLRYSNRSPTNKGQKLYNNGIEQTCFDEGEQPKGWILGMLKRKGS